MTAPGYTLTFRYAEDSIGPERTVPVYATPDEVQHLLEQGYLLRERLFDPNEVARLRDALETVSAHELERGNGVHNDSRFGGQFIRHLYDKHPVFLEFLNHPPLVSVARAVLGPAVQTRLSARISVPGQTNQQTEWHYHQPLVLPDPAPPLATFPHSLDVLVYLDDLNDANGPVALVPGSHRWRERLAFDDHADKPGQEVFRLTAGDAVFIHNNLWHRALPTHPEGTRRRLLAFSYFPVWLKNVNDGAPPEDGLTRTLYASADRETRELLGLHGYR